MRLLVAMSAITALIATPALAQDDNPSIITVDRPVDSGGSIMTFKCGHCDTEEVEQEKKAMLPGNQTIEIQMIDGERMLYRKENWLGGSPVTFITKAKDVHMKHFDEDPARADIPTVISAKPVQRQDGIARNNIPEDPTVSNHAGTPTISQAQKPTMSYFDTGTFVLRTHSEDAQRLALPGDERKIRHHSGRAPDTVEQRQTVGANGRHGIVDHHRLEKHVDRPAQSRQ